MQQVRLGETLRSSNAENTYHAFRFSQKPQSLDTSQPGMISGTSNASNSYLASFPSTKAGEHWFSGTPTPSKSVECVLIWDKTANQFVLERLDSCIKFSHERNPKDMTHKALPEPIQRPAVQPKLASPVSIDSKPKRPVTARIKHGRTGSTASQRDEIDVQGSIRGKPRKKVAASEDVEDFGDISLTPDAVNSPSPALSKPLPRAIFPMSASPSIHAGVSPEEALKPSKEVKKSPLVKEVKLSSTKLASPSPLLLPTVPSNAATPEPISADTPINQAPSPRNTNATSPTIVNVATPQPERPVAASKRLPASAVAAMSGSPAQSPRPVARKTLPTSITVESSSESSESDSSDGEDSDDSTPEGYLRGAAIASRPRPTMGGKLPAKTTHPVAASKRPPGGVVQVESESEDESDDDLDAIAADIQNEFAAAASNVPQKRPPGANGVASKGPMQGQTAHKGIARKTISLEEEERRRQLQLENDMPDSSEED